MPDIGGAAPRRQNRLCDANAWLAMPQHVRLVLTRVRGAYSDHTRRTASWRSTVLITLCNAANLMEARKQHCQLMQVGLQTAVAALDRATLNWARDAGAPAFAVAGWGFGMAQFENKQLSLHQLGPSGLSCTKIGLMRSAVAAGFDPLLLDADVAFLSDPLPLLTALVARHRVAALYESGLDERQLTHLTELAQDYSQQAPEAQPGDLIAAPATTAAFSRRRRTDANDQHQVMRPVHRLRVCRAWPEHHGRVQGHSSTLLPDVPHGFINAGFVWLRAGAAALKYTGDCLAYLREHDRSGDQEAQQAAFCQSDTFADEGVALISPTVVQTAAGRIAAEGERRVLALPAAGHATFNRPSGRKEKRHWLINLTRHIDACMKKE
jgi:hypothetical protein